LFGFAVNAFRITVNVSRQTTFTPTLEGADVMFERIRRWIALDFDAHPWWIVAMWLLVAQTTLIVVSLSVSTWWVEGTAYALLITMALFAGHVFMDAVTMRLPRPGAWAAIVVFLPPIGAILYAYHRYQTRRMVV
jgi:hypothetical protein